MMLYQMDALEVDIRRVLTANKPVHDIESFLRRELDRRDVVDMEDHRLLFERFGIRLGVPR